MEKNRRRRTRVPVHIVATVQVGEEEITLETENISLGGMLCAPCPRIGVGEIVEIRLVLGSEVVIEAKASVVRSDEKGIALGFLNIDEDGFYHLKQLVQYNADDADRIEREILQHQD